MFKNLQCTILEVSKFLNVYTFFQNALNNNFFVPNMSSTVIPANHEQLFRRNLAGIRQNMENWPESHEIVRIQQNPANPLLRHHVPGQICSSPTSLSPKKIRKKEEKKGQISPDSSEI
jgi:hypothetical protein